MTTATTRDVHPTNIDHTAIARHLILAHDRLNVDEEMVGVTIDETTTDVLLANTMPAVAAFHGLQILVVDESLTLAHDAQIRVHHLASTETETADVVRLLLYGQKQSANLPHPDVVRRRAMSLMATVVLGLRETTGKTAHLDLTEMTIARQSRNTEMTTAT
jgi:hypothetical protein